MGASVAVTVVHNSVDMTCIIIDCADPAVTCPAILDTPEPIP